MCSRGGCARLRERVFTTSQTQAQYWLTILSTAFYWPQSITKPRFKGLRNSLHLLTGHITKSHTGYRKGNNYSYFSINLLHFPFSGSWKQLISRGHLIDTKPNIIGQHSWVISTRLQKSLMNCTRSTPRTYQNTRLSLFLSCPVPHTPAVHLETSLRVDSFCRCRPPNPPTMHCSLLVSLLW